jgi:hypothetical protein
LQLLNLKHYELLTPFASNFYLRRCIKLKLRKGGSSSSGGGDGAGGVGGSGGDACGGVTSAATADDEAVTEVVDGGESESGGGKTKDTQKQGTWTWSKWHLLKVGWCKFPRMTPG